MRFYGAPRHFQLGSDFRVVTSLQKQFDDLLLAWPEPNRLLLHELRLPSAVLRRIRLPIQRSDRIITKSHSIHDAIL
jgi:hypothetical protein